MIRPPPDAGLDGPESVRVTPEGLECRYWPTAGGDPRWLPWPKPATAEWRTVLDLPVTLGDGITVGELLSRFDIPDPSLDHELFSQLTSLPEGPFARWVRPIRDHRGGALPSHLKAFEIELPMMRSPDGWTMNSGEVPSAAVVSEGKVDDAFWHDETRIQACYSLRQLLQCVLYWSPPGNSSSELTAQDQARLGEPEIRVEVGSLEELLGLEADLLR